MHTVPDILIHSDCILNIVFKDNRLVNVKQCKNIFYHMTIDEEKAK